MASRKFSLSAVERLAKGEEREITSDLATQEHAENEEFLLAIRSLLRLAPDDRALSAYERDLESRPFPAEARSRADEQHLREELWAHMSRWKAPKDALGLLLCLLGALLVLAGLTAVFLSASPFRQAGGVLALLGAVVLAAARIGGSLRSHSLRRAEEARSRSEIDARIRKQFDEARAFHEEAEKARVASLRALLAGDPAASRASFEAATAKLALPLPASARLETLTPSACQIHVQLHPLESIPVQRSTLLKSGRLSYRNRSRKDVREVHRLAFNQHLTQRDLVAVERLTAGLIKLLHPDGDFTDSELASMASLAVEMRQRVHDQLVVLAPGEFKPKRIAFEGMLPTLASDMARAPEAVQRYDRMNDHALVGEVTGLAVIERESRVVGGDLIIIEVSLVPGQTGLEITGGRGTVLRESVRAAYNLVSSHAQSFGVPADRVGTHRVLVHLVHIAEEREGPSAGIAFVVGIVSAATGRPVKPALALTGEVSLHGKVTRVGGVPEKVRTAVSYGRKTVILPRDNARDLEALPDQVLEAIEVIPVTTIDEVLESALLPGPQVEEGAGL